MFKFGPRIGVYGSRVLNMAGVLFGWNKTAGWVGSINVGQRDAADASLIGNRCPSDQYRWRVSTRDWAGVGGGGSWSVPAVSCSSRAAYWRNRSYVAWNSGRAANAP